MYLQDGISPVLPRNVRKRPRRPEKWKRNIAETLRLVEGSGLNKCLNLHIDCL